MSETLHTQPAPSSLPEGIWGVTASTQSIDITPLVQPEERDEASIPTEEIIPRVTEELPDTPATTESTFQGIISPEEVKAQHGFDQIIIENFDKARGTVARISQELDATVAHVTDEAHESTAQALRDFEREDKRMREDLALTIAAAQALYAEGRRRLSIHTGQITRENDAAVYAATAKRDRFAPVISMVKGNLDSAAESHAAFAERRDTSGEAINALAKNRTTLQGIATELREQIAGFEDELTRSKGVSDGILSEMADLRSDNVSQKMIIAEDQLVAQERAGVSFIDTSRERAKMKLAKEINLPLPESYTNLDQQLTIVNTTIAATSEDIKWRALKVDEIDQQIKAITADIDARLAQRSKDMSDNAHNNMSMSVNAVTITDQLDAINRGDIAALAGKPLLAPKDLAPLRDAMLVEVRTPEGHTPAAFLPPDFDGISLPESLRYPGDSDESSLAATRAFLRTQGDAAVVAVAGYLRNFRSLRKPKTSVKVAKRQQ